MRFQVPSPEPPSAPDTQIELPPELQAELTISVARFENQWGIMAGLARSQGYTERYRTELAAMMKLAYQKGKESCSSS